MKKKLKLRKETLRALNEMQLSEVHGGYDYGTIWCPSKWLSCYNTCQSDGPRCCCR
jgi:hypothetical protein